MLRKENTMVKKVLKTVFTSFTFYFILLSLLIIYGHYTGSDPKSLVLIWSNALLNGIRYTDFAEHVIKAGPMIKVDTISGEISLYWYIAHLISFILYGAVLDGLKALIKLLLRKTKSAQPDTTRGTVQ